MKNHDLRSLRELSPAELDQKAREAKDELFKARFALRTNQLADSSKLRKSRREYARIQTLLSEARLVSASQGVA